MVEKLDVSLQHSNTPRSIDPRSSGNPEFAFFLVIVPQIIEAEVIGYFPCLLFCCQVFYALLGLLGLLFVACDFRTTLLLSNTPTATIAFLVCHFPSPPLCGLRLLN